MNLFYWSKWPYTGYISNHRGPVSQLNWNNTANCN
jgi:hypothetical protein